MVVVPAITSLNKIVVPSITGLNNNKSGDYISKYKSRVGLSNKQLLQVMLLVIQAIYRGMNINLICYLLPFSMRDPLFSVS